MPGHIGTSIVMNSREVLGGVTKRTPEDEAKGMRSTLKTMGIDSAAFSDAQLLAMMEERAKAFRDQAPMSAAEAAKVILDGVRAEKWRILVGKDAHKLDEMVREDPEGAYGPAFFERLQREAGWGI